MTIFDEGRQLRHEAAKLRPDRRRRYPNELRRRLVDWVGRAIASGLTEADCGKLVGIKTWRFRCWKATPALTAPEAEHQQQPLALVPIAVTPGATSATTTMQSAGLSLVAPSGHRIEGLTLEQAMALLRGLT